MKKKKGGSGPDEETKGLSHDCDDPARRRDRMMENNHFLFQPRMGYSDLYVYNGIKKEVYHHHIKFDFRQGQGQLHYKNLFYFAGGKATTYSAKAHQLNSEVEVVELESMPVAKAYFPMCYWKRQHRMVTVGGYNQSNLSDVQSYCTKCDRWKKLPDMPAARSSHCAFVLGAGSLYSVGGGTARSDPIYMLNMWDRKGLWKQAGVLGEQGVGNFKYSAAVIDNEVVFFGGTNQETTYTLYKEDEEGNLKVGAKLPSCIKHNQFNSGAFKVFDGMIVAFSSEGFTAQDVYCFKPGMVQWNHFN